MTLLYLWQRVNFLSTLKKIEALLQIVFVVVVWNEPFILKEFKSYLINCVAYKGDGHYGRLSLMPRRAKPITNDMITCDSRHISPVTYNIGDGLHELCHCYRQFMGRKQDGLKAED